jgi:hypothetical protein
MYSVPHNTSDSKLMKTDSTFWVWTKNSDEDTDPDAYDDGQNPPKRIQFLLTMAQVLKGKSSKYYTIRSPVIEFGHTFDPLEMFDEFSSEVCYEYPVDDAGADSFISKNQSEIPVNSGYCKDLFEEKGRQSIHQCRTCFVPRCDPHFGLDLTFCSLAIQSR